MTNDVNAPVPEMTVHELKTLMDEQADFHLIDVREPYEFEKAKIPQSQLIPMDDVPARVQEIPKQGNVILTCRSGGRSAHVLKWLRTQGYTNLKNLQGGIKAWTAYIDPSLPQC